MHLTVLGKLDLKISREVGKVPKKWIIWMPPKTIFPIAPIASRNNLLLCLLFNAIFIKIQSKFLIVWQRHDNIFLRFEKDSLFSSTNWILFRKADIGWRESRPSRLPRHHQQLWLVPLASNRPGDENPMKRHKHWQKCHLKITTFSIHLHLQCFYSVRRLMGSLWADIKVITITEWFN